MDRSPPTSEQERLDPVVVHARREAVVILAAFGACLVWSVTSCYLTGYGAPGEAELSTVLGMPSWVFWGVLVPWLAADVFGFWFCFFYMADDPLGESEDETEVGSETADRCPPDAGGRS